MMRVYIYSCNLDTSENTNEKLTGKIKMNLEVNI